MLSVAHEVLWPLGLARHMWPLSGAPDRRIHALLGIRASMHIIFDPLDFIAKLASLVPKPKVNLTRFHGVFVGVPHHPNSKHRILVTPARRGKGRRKAIGQDKTPEERRTAMTWAQRLKRVFNIDPNAAR
jgi:hypothetical protein